MVEGSTCCRQVAKRKSARGRLKGSALVAVLAGALVIPAGAQASANVTVFAPSLYSTAALDEQVGFSWLPDNGQDFFRVVFSQTPSGGWENSLYRTPETVLNSTYASPRAMGLTPGTWYWRLCYGWYSSPSHICYWDDDIRTLDVQQPPSLPAPAPALPARPPQPQPQPQPANLPLPLSATTARARARGYASVKWSARSPKAVCHRVRSNAFRCRVTWKTAATNRARTVKVVRMSATGTTAHQ